MGWKGTVRSIGAAVRAAERDAKRKQKALEKQHKQYEKMQELEQAEYYVEVYENHIDIIQSIHKECSAPMNWNDIALTKQPKAPNKNNDNEKDARSKLDNYKPNLIDRLLKREPKRIASLLQKIEEAIKTDEIKNNSTTASWKKELEEWEENIEMANALLDGQTQARLEIIENFHPFSEISNLGSRISISTHENGLLEATVKIHGKDIVPNQTKNLLKSGKLSVKNMPKGTFNEIYQDYVCSSVLRIANELFAIIPDQLVIVTAVDELLDTKTGHLEDTTILSAAISRRTINSFNLETIDPSDSMSNFVHSMSFKKTKGFEKVNRIDPAYLDL